MASGALINSPPPFALGTSKDFSSTGDSRWVGGIPFLQSDVQQRPWVPDGRDAFISWLRAEFAAANAIIDSLCHHLQLTGKPGEYDFVLACIQQRRCNWNAVLHMQQYFSVAEVIFALQQVILRKQQMQNFDRSNIFLSQAPPIPDERSVVHKVNTQKSTKQDFAPPAVNSALQSLALNDGECHRDGSGVEESKKEAKFVDQSIDHGNRERKQETLGTSEFTPFCPKAETSDGLYMENVVNPLEAQSDAMPDLNISSTNDKCEGIAHQTSGIKDELEDEKKRHYPLEKNKDPTNSSPSAEPDLQVKSHDTSVTPYQQIPALSTFSKQTGSLSRKLSNGGARFLKQDEECQAGMVNAPKSYLCYEQIDSKMVNIVEGLELYENVFDKSKTSQLVASLHELECVRRRGKLGGCHFVAPKKWMKAKGKKNIQFGSLECAEDDERYQLIKGFANEAIEPMPSFLQDTIEILVQHNILPGNKRPDCCNAIVLDEEEYLSPHSIHYDLEKPLFILVLVSDCTAILGTNPQMDVPGEFVSPFKLILSVGSVLVLQGNSANIARTAFSNSPGKRILLLFGKLKSKKIPKVALQSPGPVSFNHSPVTVSCTNSVSSINQLGVFKVSGQVPPPANLMPPRNYASMPVPPVTRPPPSHASFAQPLTSGPAGQAGPYPSMTITNSGWTAVPGPVRVHATGTGVFLPSSGVPSSVSQANSGPQMRQVFMPIPPLQKTTSSPAALSSLDSPESSVSSRPSRSKARPGGASEGTTEQSTCVRSSIKKDPGKGFIDGKRSDAVRSGEVKHQGALDGHPNSGGSNSMKMED